QDTITRFLPDYPLQGASITIEHLLTHTSGIRDFTSIKDSVQRYKQDVSPAQMIAYFRQQPLRFAPGSRYEYSNSNYFLLGAIIEAISGQSYEEYLRSHFFLPLAMTNTSLDKEGQLVPNRASGYTKGANGFENAGFISMTQPYAAGAILSTVEDLHRWHLALHSNKLVRKETLAKALLPYRLSNGKESNYGYGFRFGFIQQSPSVWHGGLISGFKSTALFLPKEDVYVVVLANCDGSSPEISTAQLAALAIGKSYLDQPIAVLPEVLKSYPGVYENAAGELRVINVDKGRLYTQVGRAKKVYATPVRKHEFFLEDPMITLQFSVGSDNSVKGFSIFTRNGSESWTRTDKEAPSETAVKVNEQLLALYAGTYEVSPQFSFVVSQESGRLFLQAGGQEKLELFAESNSKFFLKVNDAQLEFIVEGGKVTKALLKQGGRSTDALKVR
ncbi:MAG: DUF3471 domain-containing protein, partial [Chitinophagaceae bacterium]